MIVCSNLISQSNQIEWRENMHIEHIADNRENTGKCLNWREFSYIIIVFKSKISKYFLFFQTFWRNLCFGKNILS